MKSDIGSIMRPFSSRYFPQAKRGLLSSAPPGTLGGGVVMNAGAYGGELKDVVTEVTALYPDGVKVLTPAELDFSYRHSVFSAGEGIVLGAKVKLESGDPGFGDTSFDEGSSYSTRGYGSYGQGAARYDSVMQRRPKSQASQKLAAQKPAASAPLLQLSSAGLLYGRLMGHAAAFGDGIGSANIRIFCLA